MRGAGAGELVFIHVYPSDRAVKVSHRGTLSEPGDFPTLGAWLAPPIDPAPSPRRAERHAPKRDRHVSLHFPSLVHAARTIRRAVRSTDVFRLRRRHRRLLSNKCPREYLHTPAPVHASSPLIGSPTALTAIKSHFVDF